LAVGLWNKSLTDLDLRGGCPYISNYVSSCREDSRLHGRPPRAVEGNTPKKMAGLESEVLKAGYKCITCREICTLYFAPKVILLIESRKIKLTKHVAFVREMEIVSRILVTNP